MTVRLLVTRPELEAERTAAALRARGHIVVVAPLMRIEAVDAEIAAGPWAALLVTSANAAAAMASHERCAQLRALPVFAVGRRTAQTMRAAGFVDVISADGAVGDLARLVAERMKPGTPLLYLAGADRSGDLAGDLAAQNFAVHTVVVYRAIAAPTFARGAVEALAEGVDGVLHLSRRSAGAYVSAARVGSLLEVALNKPIHFCLSARVAAPLTEAGAAHIRIAARPVETALIELIPRA